jgi:hypothetical protein
MLRQKNLDQMIEDLFGIQSLCQFFMKATSVNYCFFQIFELIDTFKRFFTSLYVTNFFPASCSRNMNTYLVFSGFASVVHPKNNFALFHLISF